MSNQQVSGALWKGYYGPYFPKSLTKAQRYFRKNPVRLQMQFYEALVQNLPTGNKKMYPRTSDGYRSYVSLSFAFGATKIRVLMPNMSDWKKTDGTFSDRHVALYTKDLRSEEVVNAAALLFSQTLEKTFREFYQELVLRGKESIPE